MSSVTGPSIRGRSLTGNAKARISCQTCQRRKSRCDLIDESGCHRCRTLQLVCSKATVTAGSSTRLLTEDRSPAIATPDVDTTNGDFQPTENTRQSKRRRLDDDFPNQRKSTLATHGGAEQVALALGLTEHKKLIHPVEGGFVDDGILRHAIARILAEDTGYSALLKEVGTPIDSVLLTAILARVAPHLREIIPLITTQMAIWDRFQPRCEVPEQAILGFIMLSGLSENKLSRVVDSFGAAERGWSLVRRCGFEGCLGQLETGWVDWDAEWMQVTRRSVKLYYTLLHRVSWNDLFVSPFLTQRSTVKTSIFLAHPYEGDDPVMRYLDHEAQLLEMLRPLGNALTELRGSRMVAKGWDQSLQKVVAQYDSAYSNWISGSKASATDSTYFVLDLIARLIRPFIYLRLSTEGVSHLPSPICASARQTLLFELGNQMYRSSKDFIRYVNSAVNTKHIQDSLSVIPSFYQTLMILPYAIVSQSIKVDSAETAGTTASGATADGTMLTTEEVGGDHETTQGDIIGNGNETNAVHTTQPDRINLEELRHYREVLYATNAHCPEVIDGIDNTTPHVSWSDQRRIARETRDGRNDVQQQYVAGDSEWMGLFDWSALSSLTDYASDDFWFRPDLQ